MGAGAWAICVDALCGADVDPGAFDWAPDGDDSWTRDYRENSGRILTARIRRRGDKWSASFGGRRLGGTSADADGAIRLIEMRLNTNYKAS